MAGGVRELTGATYGVAATGVAGPDPQDGKPVGTVHLAVSGPGERVWHRDLQLRGTREEIRQWTVNEAIDLLHGVLEPNSGNNQDDYRVTSPANMLTTVCRGVGGCGYGGAVSEGSVKQ
nr:hypothetical protein GCM10020093_104070 [Planobispora longispora]